MSALRPERVLVVSATREEAAYLPPGTPLVVTGIGKTLAAVATARALAERDGEVDLVVNLGTAGALRPGLVGLHRPSVVLNHDLSADAVRALGHDPHDRLELDRGDETVLATGDAFVSEPSVRDRLAARAHLVDMEGYAVAWACRAGGVPVLMLKHVSDSADDSALDWSSVVDASARVLAAALAELLADPAGATGGTQPG
ncbi:nucleosidase [Nocardioides ochotonae]|uniref:nucleosidase n=1 Tax=Nocardioides ochotonae TaxID=2685869 RepID=UPI001CD40065|nr:nucleosidase [Nocardioides ochotonae]